jgi:glycosyltransferase involved in cell wall biosynthesis
MKFTFSNEPKLEGFKFSLITPEHSPKNKVFLDELYESICGQTYTNWEWILYLNNGCQPGDISTDIRNDNRVKVIVSIENNTNIGAIKNKAFNFGTGDVLVEVDHDDVLTPNCLEELYKAFQDETVGFVYSDAGMYHMEDKFVPYDSNMGWTYRMFNWKGKELYAMNFFPATSHSLSYIWYAPDHVRAWKTSVYKEIGGHNPELAICDDHELCIRTYLHTKMHYIPKVLYIYRITGDNTWLARNESIQIKTKELCNQYAQKLAERDADLKGLLKVDIGGGLNPYPNYMSVDLRPDADIVTDLNDGIPLPDNSVGVLNASHILEHLHDKTKIMSEIHRVLAPGGWAFIEIPSTDGRGAFQDPTHVSYWNENSFLYYTDSYLANFIDNKTIRFQEYRKETWFPNEWLKNLNVCVTTAWLVAIKDGMHRLPGPLRI